MRRPRGTLSRRPKGHRVRLGLVRVPGLAAGPAGTGNPIFRRVRKVDTRMGGTFRYGMT